jgi:hypothetical protein
MALSEVDINVQQHNYDPIMVVDESSSTEYYVGVSISSTNQGAANWKIKRIWKIGNVWKFGFPNGDQKFKFVWDDRYGYTYS